MLYLKQSTAVTVKIGPFIDDTDGKTAETAMGLVQSDIRLSKNSGDIAQKTSATSPTHDELGLYDCALDTTDTGTLGRLQLWVHKAGALPVWHEYMVVTANHYDTLFSTDVFDVSVTQWTGTNVATPQTAGYPVVTNKVGTGTGELNLSSGAIPAASLATQAKADVNAEMLDVLTVDTFAEPGAVPAATSTIKDKVNWLFALSRNKLTQTSTTATLRNDADSGNVSTASVSDDGTTTIRNEWA